MSIKRLLILMAVVLVITPLTAIGVGAIVVPTFSDVPESHPFFEEIEWMAATGISTGYADGTYRPNNAVTRQAMSAFMQRLAQVFDADLDGTVDSAVVAVRHSQASYAADLASSAYLCSTTDVTLSNPTFVVVQGSVSAEPTAATSDDFYLGTSYSNDGGSSWGLLDFATPEATLALGEERTVTFAGSGILPAGTYRFSAQVYGIGNLTAGTDLNGYCDLVATAYTGLGDKVDISPDIALDSGAGGQFGG